MPPRERGRERLADALRRQVARGRLGDAEAAAILARVGAARVTAEGLAGCGLVIESVPEDRAIKGATLGGDRARRARTHRSRPTPRVSSIARLGEALPDPARFLGLHFFSPAERMPLIEVVRGPQTVQRDADDGAAFVRASDRQAPDRACATAPVFSQPRVFAAYLDEAVAMVAEGVAPEAIDAAATSTGARSDRSPMLDETGIALNLAQARQASADGSNRDFAGRSRSRRSRCWSRPARRQTGWRRLLRLA